MFHNKIQESSLEFVCFGCDVMLWNPTISCNIPCRKSSTNPQHNTKRENCDDLDLSVKVSKSLTTLLLHHTRNYLEFNELLFQPPKKTGYFFTTVFAS